MTTLLHRTLIANQYGLKILGGGGRVPPRWREEGTSCMDPAVSTMTWGQGFPFTAFLPTQAPMQHSGKTGPCISRWSNVKAHGSQVLTVNLWDGGMEGTAAS